LPASAKFEGQERDLERFAHFVVDRWGLSAPTPPRMYVSKMMGEILRWTGSARIVVESFYGTGGDADDRAK
jgi:hypothetical protein